MNWKAPFVVYRITEDGKLTAVYVAEDIKKAKYWLQFIAQPGDLLCKTPVHPKHTKQSQCPEYWGHKESSGKPSSVEADWKKYAEEKNFDFVFPTEQVDIK